MNNTYLLSTLLNFPIYYHNNQSVYPAVMAWVGGRVLDNVQTQLMLYFGGSNPAWGDYTRCNYVL